MIWTAYELLAHTKHLRLNDYDKEEDELIWVGGTKDWNEMRWEISKHKAELLGIGEMRY